MIDCTVCVGNPPRPGPVYGPDAGWMQPTKCLEEKQVAIMSQSAVVRISDVQFRVSENEVVRVPLLQAEIGTKLEFDEVLLVGGDEVKVGTPLVEGAKVRAEVIEQGKEDKIVVFKKKRRKNYQKTQGHRQAYTAIKITAIEA
jgi:large subunit ribosomal protein L21